MPNGYSKPVVTEAILDLRTALPSGSPADVLAKFVLSLKDRFPRQEAILTGTVQFEFYQGNPLPPEASQKHGGFRITSDDSLRVLQISEEGFTFSHLQPYAGWDAFSAEARELWGLYKTSCNLQEVTRVGLRYINRIDIPIGERISTFLALRPHLPENLPSRDILGFFMQLQLPQQDLESLLIINQARAVPPNEDTFSVVLDLDLVRDGTWSANQDEAVWELLGRFRIRKNEYFEASIEEKTRRLMD